MNLYKCPMCNQDIEVSNTSIVMDTPRFIDNNVSVKVETTIKHTGISEPLCDEFMQLFAKEQHNILTKWLDASQKKLPTSKE